MKTKNTTMQKIADELSLSRNAVSSVLNGKAKERRISEKTVKRVMEYVKKTGFHQDLSALSMRGKYSKDVAIITSPFIFPHHRKLFFHLMDYLNREKFSFVNLFFSPDNASELLQQLKFFNFKKIIFIAYNLKREKDYSAWNSLRTHLKDCKIFYYDYPFEAQSTENLTDSESVVGVDRIKMDLQTNSLLRKSGYRKVIKRIFINNEKTAADSILKFESYTEKLKLEYKKRTDIFYEDDLLKAGYHLAESYKNYNFTAMPTAFFIYDSFICSGLLSRFRELKIKIPENVGIILSWAESHELRYSSEITSWIFPHDKMFKELRNWLISDDYRLIQKFDIELHKGKTLKQY